jgi:hypothetical protein
MTTRIVSLSLVILLTISIALPAQNAGRTFTKSFNTDSKGTIRLDLVNAIDLKIWDNPSVRIDIMVSLPAGRGPMLNELANVGRYNLTAKSLDAEDTLVITAPNLAKHVRIKGEELKESISYMIFVPKNLKIEMPNSISLADPGK